MKRHLAEVKDSADFLSWRVGKLMGSEHPQADVAIFIGALELQAGRIVQAVANLHDVLRGENEKATR